MNAWDPSWFFIVGCQRSGTTLVRLILECHSQVECRDEVISYGVIAGRRTIRRERRLVGLKVPCLTEQFARPSMYDVAWVPMIANGYRDHPVLFMIRDARDTVASMRELRVFGKPWFETSLPSTLKAKQQLEPEFVERYRDALAALADSPHPAVAAAAFYWRYKTDALSDYVDRQFPVLPVRYERLVAVPQGELSAICAFLQIPWEPGLLDHPTFRHREIDSKGIAMGGTDAKRSIDRDSVGRWQSALSESEAAEVLRFAGPRQTEWYGDTPA